MSSIMRWRRGLVVAIGASCPERGGCDHHILSDGRFHRSDLPAAPKEQVRSIGGRLPIGKRGRHHRNPQPQAECMVVLMGATAEGKKELIGFQTGMRESGQSWKELLVDLKARGLVVAPQVAIGDGALGFWKALDEAFPTTRHQRCWLHKTLNVLDKLPKSMQPNAHKDLREIWLSPSRAAAEAAMTTFAEKYAPKYHKAVECLTKDRQTLLTFFDFPADHWDHLRTS